MRKTNLLAALLLATSSLLAAPTTPPEEASEKQCLFQTTGHGRPYRIPALACTRKGQLIAMTDDRYCGADIGYGRVDILARMSKDNGKTWSPEYAVATGDGIDASPTCGYGDAAVVADRKSNAVMLLCVSAPKGGTCWTKEQRGVIAVSPDGGKTWPTPRDIKDEICGVEGSLLGPDVINYFVGSGKLHQSRYIKVGTHYRVYAALWTVKRGGARANYVIYTDNFGKNWHLLGNPGEPCVVDGDEPKCEEMPDGSVIISSRKRGGRFYNVFTYDKVNNKDFAKGSWGKQVEGCTSGDRATDGEILVLKAKRADGAVVPLVFQSMPNEGRNKVTIWYKELTTQSTLADLAGDWTVARQISDTSSAYSTMCVQKDGRIGFYYEEGPGTYEMVYTSLSLPYLTQGKYTKIVK
ncbi:MAG: exo-alpha-sialidase [Bacteroidales bacterium]|nr:exo-alpha-sialidase [Candidatus Physcousia equi]